MLPQPLKPAIPDEPSDTRVLATDAIERRADAMRALRHAGALFAQAVVLLALVSLFFLRVPEVDGHSMAPQIDDGDHVLINTLAYSLRIARPGGGDPLVDASLRPIERGDVIAFVHGDGDDRKIYLKRVIGLPGETIAMQRGAVRVDGAPLAQTFGADADTSGAAPVTIGRDAFFVLGDNRGDSDDSRAFGPIPASAVIGRAALVVWPPNRARAIR